jgi:MFS family permease
VTGFAVLAGPAAGGFITQNFGWQSIFWINLPIGLIAIVVALTRLR